ncbi:MAG: alkylation response protein AidB-like acyl-CoA dehydrogenase [Verrucomicrobiales bacterium]|jgi:alkylation response protein AidB-like acyl-CoA dehydrogenase
MGAYNVAMVDSANALTADEAEGFRVRCREVLDVHAVGGTGVDAARRFLGGVAEAGLGGLVFAKEFGGAGLTRAHDKIWRSEKASYPSMDSEFVISHGMCLPVLNDFGTEDQRKHFMPKNITGEQMWCQMFSEPGAGSDVASLQTSAMLDGDEWIINGQKAWTTLAHRSDYGVLIARTNPEVPKHAGISMFIVDMHAAGIEIRPIHQIDGGKQFNEVFFTDLRIPKDWLLGELNNGWNQATAMLMYERFAIGSLGAGDIAQPNYDILAKAAKKNGKITDPVIRDELMQLYAMETTKSMVAMRTRAEMKAGKAPGPGGSLGKLSSSVIQWRFRSIAQNIQGPDSIAWNVDDDAGARLATQVLSSFQAGIAGGTDEIQRNIIGDRVLGLPRDISVDKGVPFNELRRS